VAPSGQSKKAAKGSTPVKRNETAAERADRNLGELLQELRVALPGVQVLFAFLLTVPFSQGFDKLQPEQRELYFGVLMCTAISTALLIAPSAHHRMLFRKRDKEHLVRISNRLTLAGLAVLAIALTGAVLLISDLIFKTTLTIVFTVGAGATFVILWAVLPLYRRAALSEAER
jgi:high-affinity Fe2+/Pb2+ permease